MREIRVAVRMEWVEWLRGGSSGRCSLCRWRFVTDMPIVVRYNDVFFSLLVCSIVGGRFLELRGIVYS